MKQSGKFLSENRSMIFGSVRFACATNFGSGAKYPSSFQWTAIEASLASALTGSAFGTFVD